MLNRGLLSALLILGLGVLSLTYAAESSPVPSINQNDHSALVTYYSHQAQDLREKGKHWDMIAEAYEKHQEPGGKMSSAEHAAHCRTIAKDYRQAADEADALASEHRAKLPHGVVR
jgi:hypothetical protein